MVYITLINVIIMMELNHYYAFLYDINYNVILQN